MSFLLPDVTGLIFDPEWKKILELRKGDGIRGSKSSPYTGLRMSYSPWFSCHVMDFRSLRLVREKGQEVWSILSQCSFPQVVPGEQEDNIVLLNYRMWKENYIRKEGDRRQFFMEKDVDWNICISFIFSIHHCQTLLPLSFKPLSQQFIC